MECLVGPESCEQAFFRQICRVWQKLCVFSATDERLGAWIFVWLSDTWLDSILLTQTAGISDTVYISKLFKNCFWTHTAVPKFIMQSYNYKTSHLNLPFGALSINTYLLYCTSVIRDDLLDTESDLKHNLWFVVNTQMDSLLSVLLLESLINNPLTSAQVPIAVVIDRYLCWLLW